MYSAILSIKNDPTIATLYTNTWHMSTTILKTHSEKTTIIVILIPPLLVQGPLSLEFEAPLCKYITNIHSNELKGTYKRQD